MTRPCLFRLPLGLPALPALIEAVSRGPLRLGTEENDAFALADTLLIVPTTRARRWLLHNWHRVAGSDATLLPRIVTLSDLEGFDAGQDVLAGDDVDVSVPPRVLTRTQRSLLLAPLVQAWALRLLGDDVERAETYRYASTSLGALVFAEELGQVLDGLRLEGVSFEALAKAPPHDLSAHWDVTLRFLTLARDHWPSVLKSLDAVDEVALRESRLARLMTHWQRHPPTTRVIVVGSTGSVPSTASLMRVVAGLPKGALVFEGFDSQMSASTFQTLTREGAASDPLIMTHPQAAMAQMVASLGMQPADVQTLGQDQPAASLRFQLLQLAFAPADETAHWDRLSAPLRGHDLFAEALSGLCVVEADTLEDEASLITALIEKRGGLGTSVITPNRDLVARLHPRLRAKGLVLDDSAGRPFATSDLFIHMQSFLEAAAKPCCATWLAWLDRPHGLWPPDQGPLRQKVMATVLHALEFEDLTGWRRAFARTQAQRHDPHSHRVYKALGDDDMTSMEVFLSALSTKLTPPWPVCTSVPLREWAQWLLDHLPCVIDLDAFPVDDVELLFDVLTDLTHDEGLLACTLYDVPALMHLLLGQHQRREVAEPEALHVYGLPEARLLHEPGAILASLNEGQWPPLPSVGPFLSRALLRALNMMALERRIGLATHDFVMAAVQGHVVITRALKEGGTPQLRSRLLERLRALDKENFISLFDGKAFLASLGCDASFPPFVSTPRGRPKPPLSRRPLRYSVSDLRDLVQAPYVFYARKILRLLPLQPPKAHDEQRLFGQFIHNYLEDVVGLSPQTDLVDWVSSTFSTRLETFGVDERRAGLWRYRVMRLLPYFEDLRSHARLCRVEQETPLSLSFIVRDHLVRLHARADRIDILPDGRLQLYDYKTGAAPSKNQVLKGDQPQLSLEAALLLADSSRCAAASCLDHIAVIQPTGLEPPVGVKVLFDRADAIETLAHEALAGAQNLINAFLDEDRAYHPATTRFDDYCHLMRIDPLSEDQTSTGDDA